MIGTRFRAAFVAGSVGLGLLSGVPAARAQHESAARSVVLIRCSLPGGVAKATGFVWPEPGLVVTALHAVAGCDEIEVSSEATKGIALATVARVDLEADLALLELDNDLLGVPAVNYAEAPPDTLADFVTFGYPLSAEQMIRLRIEFGGGLESDVTTLGGAFASDELEDSFRGQNYPTRETKILRVNSTIQPGRSGAPIFDRDGSVVAIVDGGLLGGWRTINWSIPAHVYLPDLLLSEDPPPEGPSPQTILHSSVTPTDSVEVAFERQGDAAAEAADTEDALVLVRQIGLNDFAEMNGLGGDGSMVEEIRTLVGDDEAFGTLTFDIYEDTMSGATIGVPSGTELYWNPDLEVIEAVNAWQTVRLTVLVTREGSFDEAFATAEDFMARHAEEIVWNEKQGANPAVVDVYDAEAEVAELVLSDTGKVPDTGEDVELILGVYASGPDFLGTTVTAIYGDETWADVDQVDYLMMEFGSRFLTNFAVN